jgi:hypothetical protein
VCATSLAFADPAPERASASSIDIHGFVSEGGFVSTANDYIGTSSRGSLEFFELGLNVTTEVADRLRVGAQLFARDEGEFHDVSPRIDWAYLDYRWKPWLGLRAGVIKMPFGLYNEYVDADAARLPILLPQALYPIRDRDALLAHRGFSIYGSWGPLDYQAWLGTLIIPPNALEVVNASLDRIDDKYVVGGQVFWHPIDGLRIGGTVARTSIDFYLSLDPGVTSQLVMAGLVPMDFDGKIVVSQRPDTFLVGSAEYVHDDWLFAAEYSRSRTHQVISLPALQPPFDRDSERFYAMATYRLSPRFETGGYYSVAYADVHDRHGHDPMYAESFLAWQKDLAATLRFDVNDHWLWKLEGHFIDGAADLTTATNPKPTRYWGMFLARTTVTF